MCIYIYIYTHNKRNIHIYIYIYTHVYVYGDLSTISPAVCLFKQDKLTTTFKEQRTLNFKKKH